MSSKTCRDPSPQTVKEGTGARKQQITECSDHRTRIGWRKTDQLRSGRNVDVQHPDHDDASRTLVNENGSSVSRPKVSEQVFQVKVVQGVVDVVVVVVAALCSGGWCAQLFIVSAYGTAFGIGSLEPVVDALVVKNVVALQHFQWFVIVHFLETYRTIRWGGH